MNDSLEQFRDLALRALDHPGEPALREEIAAQLSAHPEWAAAWRELRESHRLVREAAHAAEARTHADRTTEIPAARLAALLGNDRAAPAAPATLPRRRHRGRWLGLVAGIALVVSAAWLVKRPPAPAPEKFDVTPWLAHASPSLTRALTAPFSTVVASAQLPTLRNEVGLQLRSPLLAAAAGEVPIVWQGDGAVAIALLRNGQPVWNTPEARSGVRSPALPADRVYELVLTPATGPAVRERFVTVAPTGASGDATGFAPILAAITSEPARLGEAVVAWHTLPETLRHSETGLRLGLWLGVEARQPDILEAARAQATAR